MQPSVPWCSSCDALLGFHKKQASETFPLIFSHRLQSRYGAYFSYQRRAKHSHPNASPHCVDMPPPAGVYELDGKILRANPPWNIIHRAEHYYCLTLCWLKLSTMVRLFVTFHSVMSNNLLYVHCERSNTQREFCSLSWTSQAAIPFHWTKFLGAQNTHDTPVWVKKVTSIKLTLMWPETGW